MAEQVDIAIIGAGAGGLMAGIWAGRTAREAGRPLRVVIVDGARHIGAKILVAGGGRCNVTHDVVDENAYFGASRMAIRKVLRRFDVLRTIEFFRDLGVHLKREETGKLFPTTDDARTVLNALLLAANDLGVEVRHPWRVAAISREPGCNFAITKADDVLVGRRVILAPGGQSLPKTGSDGAGYLFARALGHSVTDRIFPALVPLKLPAGHPLCQLSGISARATLEVRSATGRRLAQFTDSVLCTHFGLSGPAALDISRHLIHARFDDAGAFLTINWLPEQPATTLDAHLQAVGQISAGRFLRERGLAARLAETLCEAAGVSASDGLRSLSREQRCRLVQAIADYQTPIIGDRGFTHAEVTAGGLPLRELHLDTMESRICPGLHVIGEICDVDGRIGGYNFQWAWSSGYVAGVAAARSVIKVSTT